MRAGLQALVLAGVVGVLLAFGGAVAPVALAADDPEGRLIEQYVPRVVIREQVEACGDGEPYLPTPVEAVLGRPDVALVGPDGQRIAGPSASDIAGLGEGWYLDLPGNPLSPGCDYEEWFRATGSGLPPSVYARIARDPDYPGMLVLQYWFFWVFNDWNDRHEGDWEMIQLLFESDSPAAALASGPVSVAFAQHEGSETADWNDPKILRDGDHVVVYPGQGSHAAYFTQAQWFGKSAAAGFGCDDTLAQGRLLEPEAVVVTDDPRFDWLAFSGRWGEKAPSFNNGPTGPAMKTQWARPVTWQLEHGREGAVALPVVGGPAVDSFCSLTRAGSLLFIAILDQPIFVSLVLLVAVLLLIGLSRSTRWRHGGDIRPDRERRAGQVVSASLGMMWRYRRHLWPLLLVVGLAAAGALALQQLVLRTRPAGDVTDVNGLVDEPLGLGLAIVVGFAVAPLVAVALAATARVIGDLARGTTPRPWQALSLSIRRPAGALVQVTVYFGVTLLASSLVLIPLALWFIALWAVAMPAAVIEERRYVEAFRRSMALTRGRRWRAVFLSALLVWVGFSLPGAVGGVLLLLTGWPFWVTNLAAIVLSAVLLPFSAIGLTLQFFDFRQEHDRDATRSVAKPSA